MGPFHRDLDGAQLELVGQKQQLRIEAPALDVLPRKNRVCRRPGKCLEAALRVAIAQSQDDPQTEVEQPSVQLAIPGLAFGLQFCLQPARADGDVGALLRCASNSFSAS